MLKTSSKKARENIRAYILDNYTPDNYDDAPGEGAPLAEIAAFILADFRRVKWCSDYDRRRYRTESAAFAGWAADLPSILDTCYYYNRSAADDLGAILEESEQEKAKYSESDAESMLSYLIFRELCAAAA